MDIDGSDAFDRVFEKTLDLTEKLERQRATINERDVTITSLKYDIEILKGNSVSNGNAMRLAQTDRSKYEKALASVWKTARKVADEPMNLTAAADLKEVLKATEELVDPIPF